MEYIYVIELNNLEYQDGHRKIKIGYTTNPDNRFNSYRTTSPDGIKVHGVYKIVDAKIIEQYLHLQYKNKSTVGENREWFNLTEFDLHSILNFLGAIQLADEIRNSSKLSLTDKYDLVDTENDNFAIYEFLDYCNESDMFEFSIIPTNLMYYAYLNWFLTHSKTRCYAGRRQFSNKIVKLVEQFGYKLQNQSINISSHNKLDFDLEDFKNRFLSRKQVMTLDLECNRKIIKSNYLKKY